MFESVICWSGVLENCGVIGQKLVSHYYKGLRGVKEGNVYLVACQVLREFWTVQRGHNNLVRFLK